LIYFLRSACQTIYSRVRSLPPLRSS
jgi:hypothetical protein